MKRIILESPYAGDVLENIKYARECMKDSLMRGEAPLLSHLLYTQVLDDNIWHERELGINAGLAWLTAAKKHVFYIDYGYSKGMLAAKELSEEIGIKIEERKLYLDFKQKNQILPLDLRQN